MCCVGLRAIGLSRVGYYWLHLVYKTCLLPSLPNFTSYKTLFLLLRPPPPPDSRLISEPILGLRFFCNLRLLSALIERGR